MTEEKINGSALLMLPEAPASVNFRVPWNGWDVQFTLRDNDEEALMERLVMFRAVIEENGFVSEPKQAPPASKSPPPAPSKVEAVSADVETQVWSEPITLEVKEMKGGKRYLTVKGGSYTQYGAPAWPEVIPFDIGHWGIGVEYEGLPDGLTEVVVQMGEYKGKTVPEKVIELR